MYKPIRSLKLVADQYWISTGPSDEVWVVAVFEFVFVCVFLTGLEHDVNNIKDAASPKNDFAIDFIFYPFTPLSLIPLINHFCKTINNIRRGNTEIVFAAISFGKFAAKLPWPEKN